MKNLTKHLLLLLIIFPVIILLFSVFSGKALAQDIPQCDSLNNGKTMQCDALGDFSKGCDPTSDKPTMCLTPNRFNGLFGLGSVAQIKGENVICCNVVLTPTPTPTPTPIPTNTPVPTNTPTPQPVLTWKKSYFACTVAPTSTPTPTPIPSSTCGPSDCSTCAKGSECSQKSDVPTKSCECQLIKTPTAIPTSALAPNLNCGDQTCSADKTCIGNSDDPSARYCITKAWYQTGAYCGKPDRSANDEVCASGLSCDKTTLRCAVVPTPTTAPACQTPSDCKTPLSACQQTGGATACNNGVCVYQAKDIGTRCSDANGYPGVCIAGSCDITAKSCNNLKQNSIQYNCQSDPCTGETEVGNKIVCSAGQYCCKTPLLAATTATPTATPSATLNNTNLILQLNIQDVTIPGALTPEISVYNFTDKSLITHSPGLQFTKSSFQGIQYKSGMSLPNLPQGKYLIVARQQINNSTMTAKSSFTVSGTNQTINVPTETKAMTLVFGDLNNDDSINISDYQNQSIEFTGFRYCLKPSIATTSDCRSSDFNNSGFVDGVDFTTFLKGWAKWNEETKNL